MPDYFPRSASLSRISKDYPINGRTCPAVRNVSLDIHEGETIALLGPSGCGKSTLLLILAGLEKPTSGSVVFQGEPLRRPHRSIALALQDHGLFPWKTVRENVELGLRIRKEPRDGARIHALLVELDIAEKADVYPQQLSGGQKQRVALARALILEPRLLLLDEPFAALDTITRERLQELVSHIQRTRRFSMVTVTHSIQEAVALGQRIVIMAGSPGEIVEMIDNPHACEPDYQDSPEFMSVYARARAGLRTRA